MTLGRPLLSLIQNKTALNVRSTPSHVYLFILFILFHYSRYFEPLPYCSPVYIPPRQKISYFLPMRPPSVNLIPRPL